MGRGLYLYISAVALAACSTQGPVHHDGEVESIPLSVDIPQRTLTGAIMGADRSGDLRPEAIDILDYVETVGHTVTLGDVRDEQLIADRPLGDALAAYTVPQTIRVWRRGLDGSTASCSGRVDVIPMEQYVKGVLPHEWISSWHDESLKAGAVAIRTYASWWVNAGGKYSCADLDDTTASQVYEDEFLPVTDAAVDATAGVFVVRDGDLVFAEYSAENSNPTEFGVDEPHCDGLSVFGHGRGVCQWGTQRWASNEGRTFDWIVTHYYPDSELDGLEQLDDAAFAGESYVADMVSGEEIVVYLEYTNTGNTTWGLTETMVGTTEPRDRDSAFFVDGNWVSPSRTTGADHSDYTPGSVGRFTWLMRAPEVTGTTVFTESFALVDADGEWFGPADDAVTWTITVHPASSEDPDDPDDTDIPGETPDDPDDPNGEVTGGCSASGSSTGMGAVLMVFLIFFVARTRRQLIVALSLIYTVGACSPGTDRGGDEPRYTASPLGGDSDLRDVFDAAEAAHGVPAEILATISYIETRLRFVNGYADDQHRHAGPGKIGLMGLSEDDAARGASLAGYDEAAVHLEMHANVHAAAAIIADAVGPQRPETTRAWIAALREVMTDRMADDIAAHLARGWAGTDAGGAQLVCSSRARSLSDTPDGFGQTELAAGYPGAAWDAAHSSNYSNASRGAAQINYVVIHTIQGSYSGAISWFKNPSSNVSAHYVVRSSDGAKTQMVDDADIGWHDACFNTETIGIEHEGYVDNPGLWYTDAMYMESAKITAWLADQYNIPKTRDYIFGHGEAPDCSSHTDPGSGWDWNKYMSFVTAGGVAEYDAAYAASDFPDQMESGEEAVVWFEFVNDSNVTWDLNLTRLGTAEPQDRESPFYVDGNWFSPNRATGADHSNYTPGTTGRFTFAIRAPEVDEPTTYVEWFQLVQEEVTWFGPTAAMTITVVPEGWTGEDPDPDPDPSDPSASDPDGVISQPGGPGGDVTGGCQASSNGGASGALWLLGLALVALRRRRRR